MAIPTNPDTRMFYRAAGERFTDARFILDRADRTTAAVYLAGYAVECMLKALILSQLAAAPRRKMLDQFRGSKAHDYDWLRERYRDAGGPAFPPAVTDAFVLAESWGTELRDNPKRIDSEGAEAFLAAADTILTWADGRL